MKPPRRRAPRRHVEERTVAVDARELVAGAREIGRDTTRAATELHDTGAGLDAEAREPCSDEAVARPMPEVPFLGGKERGDVVAIGDVERRIVRGEPGPIVRRRAAVR